MFQAGRHLRQVSAGCNAVTFPARAGEYRHTTRLTTSTKGLAILDYYCYGSIGLAAIAMPFYMPGRVPLLYQTFKHD